MTVASANPLPHDKTAFARPRGSFASIRRCDLPVHIARTASSRPRQHSAPPDPAAVAEAGSTILTEIKRRFTICQGCEHSRNNTFACDLYPTCCFGRFRSDLTIRCPAGKW